MMHVQIVFWVVPDLVQPYRIMRLSFRCSVCSMPSESLNIKVMGQFQQQSDISVPR